MLMRHSGRFTLITYTPLFRSTYCGTFGPTRGQSVVDPPQTDSARAYDLSNTFTLPADCPYFKVIERNVNVKSTYSNVSLVDRKSTRLNSSHLGISYAVFCLKK